jgi:hypothetical protein
MQVLRDHVYLVHNPRRDLVRNMSPRRDYNHMREYSRDRSRRTWLVEIV